MELTIQEQIDVLKAAKKVYLSATRRGDNIGMCYGIDHALYDNHRLALTYSKLSNAVPSFNKSLLQIASDNGLIPKMDECNRYYWWDCYDHSIRPKVYNYLIKQLKKELK